MKKIINLSLLVGMTILLSNSCKKSSTGPAGKDGSANVTPYTFSASSWLYNAPYYHTYLNVPALTSANINTAAVMVYFSIGNNWIAVPYTQYHSPYNYFMAFDASVGTVEVTWIYDTSLSTGSDPNSYYSTTVQYKVVVIPPAVAKANHDLDLRNYEAVKQRFNLAD